MSTTLNLPYSEHEIKIEGFGGRPPFGGRPGALGPLGPPLNPALHVEGDVPRQSER